MLYICSYSSRQLLKLPFDNSWYLCPIYWINILVKVLQQSYVENLGHQLTSRLEKVYNSIIKNSEISGLDYYVMRRLAID